MTERMNRPVVAVTIGDPAGVGPEIVVKAVVQGQLKQVCRPWIVGDLSVLEWAAKVAGVPLRFWAGSAAYGPRRRSEWEA